MNVFDIVTDSIIAELEKGVIPWTKPWVCTNGAISRVTGKPYSLLNQLLLAKHGAGEYVTFRQAIQEGGYVRKGEKGSAVVFWKPMEEINKETGEVKKHFVLRYYTVFHISQCEGLVPRFAVSVQKPGENLQPNAAMENIIAAYLKRSGVSLHVQESNEAYYCASTDEIVVPELKQYVSVPEYYSTLTHECIHSTGHPNRLNRLHGDAFGSEGYSAEELVAELGAAFLLNNAGIDTESTLHRSAAYISNWLTVLKNDKRLIVTAAGKAEKAVHYILGDIANEEEQEEENV